MKRYNLFKISHPGWSLRGANLDVTLAALNDNICSTCILEEADMALQGNTEEWLCELLSTRCGSEFHLEETPSNFIERMEIEYDDLADKTHALSEFIETDKFKELSLWERVMLEQQHHSMKAYENTLLARLKFYKKEEKND